MHFALPDDYALYMIFLHNQVLDSFRFVVPEYSVLDQGTSPYNIFFVDRSGLGFPSKIISYLVSSFIARIISVRFKIAYQIFLHKNCYIFLNTLYELL